MARAESRFDARVAAAEAVRAVMTRRGSLDTVWPPLQARLDDSRDRALAREIASGTLRWLVRLDYLLAQLATRSPRDARVRAVLLTGLYQLRSMRVAPHAAISESVETVRAIGRDRASGFVNAVLRRYQREHERLERAADRQVETRHACPAWFCERIRADWPDDSERLLAACNERAPMWLRVNTRRIAVEDWLAQASQTHGAVFQRHGFVATAVRPERAVEVSALPGFETGLVSVQDAGAQLAAPLLDLADGQRVLDACAAPGGKSGHMLETADIALTAVDNNASRLERLRANLARLDLNASVRQGDAARPAHWWDGEHFDRILLDVPCSSSGVVRRHPDIKLLRQPGDLAGLARRQRQLLDACWPLLAPGGRLVYATCSVFRCENDDVVEDFLRAHPQAVATTPDGDWGRRCARGRQTLPGEADMDGFYYSCLEHA